MVLAFAGAFHKRYELLAFMYVEFLIYVRRMRLSGAVGNAECVLDVGSRVSLGKQGKDLALSLGQTVLLGDCFVNLVPTLLFGNKGLADDSRVFTCVSNLPHCISAHETKSITDDGSQQVGASVHGFAAEVTDTGLSKERA